MNATFHLPVSQQRNVEVATRDVAQVNAGTQEWHLALSVERRAHLALHL